MSHFIKDEEGNYHEYSDEQYAELESEKSRQGGLAAGFFLIAMGFVFAFIFKLFNIESIPWWIGLCISLIGMYVFKVHATKTELIIMIIIAVLAYGGGFWLINSIHAYGSKDKTETTASVIKETDVQIAVFSKCSGDS